jgi:conserved oligomeric Golgi complex subunit 5
MPWVVEDTGNDVNDGKGKLQDSEGGRNDLATISLAEPCLHLVRDYLIVSSLSLTFLIDYATFAHPSFDANEYANAILAAQPYRITTTATDTSAHAKGSSTTSTMIDSAGTNKEEISVALAKLSFGIDDVNRQLKNVINVHHEALLSQAASVNQLEGSLRHVNAGLKDISSSVTRCASFLLSVSDDLIFYYRLRTKLSTPYAALQSHVTRLQKLQVASDVLRRVARFFMLCRRLDVQIKLINRASTTAPPGAALPKVVNGSASDSPTTPRAAIVDEELEVEKERERAIIKAALSVAEICSSKVFPHDTLTDLRLFSSTGRFDLFNRSSGRGASRG